jgi:hypothetical protein
MGDHVGTWWTTAVHTTVILLVGAGVTALLAVGVAG